MSRDEPADVDLLERSQVSHEGPKVERLRLRHRRHDRGWSDELERFVAGAGRRAVAVLAWDPVVDKIILVEQFRSGAWLASTDPACPSPVSPWMLEVIAGSVEAGADLAEVARQELLEEGGCVAEDLIRVACWCPDPEQSAATMTLYATRTRAPASESVRGNADEHEDLQVRLLGPEAIDAALAEGTRVANAVTLVALQWFVGRGRAILAGLG